MRSNASRPAAKKLIEMVMEGVAPSVVKDELNANAARRDQLEAKLATTEEPPPLLHPEMAQIFRTKVTELATALQEPDSRSEATGGAAPFVTRLSVTSCFQSEVTGSIAPSYLAPPLR